MKVSKAIEVINNRIKTLNNEDCEDLVLAIKALQIYDKVPSTIVRMESLRQNWLNTTDSSDISCAYVSAYTKSIEQVQNLITD